jgi:signal transduction histidine kinase
MAADEPDCGRGRDRGAGRDRVAAIISTAAVGTVVAFILWGTARSDPMPLFVLDVVVAVVSCALIPVMLRHPASAGLVLSALAALSPVATTAATLAALHTARRRRFPVALAVAAAGIAGHAIQGWWRPDRGVSYLWWLLLVTAAYAALVGWGALAQARAALVSSLRERATRAEAEQDRRVVEARMAERTRIAREMHDVLAHRLSLLATYAGALEYRPDAPPEQLAAAAGVVRAGVHQALDELRQVVTVLRDDDGSDDRPQPMLADVPGLIAESQDAGLTVHVDNRITAHPEPPTAIGRTAYRIVQEALTNARRHATGQPVAITLDGAPGGRLTIDISNPLPDRAPAIPASGAGTGLIGLAERVHLTGGALHHTADTGNEFRLSAWLPWT